MLTLLHRLRSDDALMQAYQRGDADAFECLYHRHKDGLFAFLYRSCGRLAIVEELAQEAWMAVVNRAADYEGRGQFKTWLYQIGHNRLTDFWRRRDNQHAALESVPEPVALQSAESVDELREEIMQALSTLPQEQRDVLLLREQGFSTAEITEITGAGVETVKSRLRYGRKQLRAQLGDEE